MKNRRSILALCVGLSTAALSAAIVRAGRDDDCEDRNPNGNYYPTYGRHHDDDCYHSVPEIDGGTLPKGILFLTALYLFYRNRRRSL